MWIKKKEELVSRIWAYVFTIWHLILDLPYRWQTCEITVSSLWTPSLAHDSILYPLHYSHLQNRVEAVRDQRSEIIVLWLVMFPLAATTTRLGGWSVKLIPWKLVQKPVCWLVLSQSLAGFIYALLNSLYHILVILFSLFTFFFKADCLNFSFLAWN